MRKIRPLPDYSIFVAALFLTGLGIMILFSSSAVSAANLTGDSYYFFKRQLFWTVPALILFGAGLFIPYRFWKRIIFLIMGGTFFLILLTYVPIFNIEAYGASRWIKMGPISFQPSELGKLCAILYLSSLLAHKPLSRWEMKNWLIALLPIAVLLLLVYKQPDLGTAMIIGAIALALMFLAGLSPRIIGFFLIFASFFVLITSWLTPYKQRRLAAFLNPWADPNDTGYHIIQSLLALGSGGLWGEGLGQGKQKLYYLPTQHSDFIFAVLGEELGLIGTLLVVALFLFIAYRGLIIAKKVEDPLAKFIASGIVVYIALQAFLNIGVVTASLPTTGVPLPFISAGGTSLLVTFFSLGILLNISMSVNQKKEVPPS